MQLEAFQKQLLAFVTAAPGVEAGARRLLRSVPGVGEVTAEVVLADFGDVGRFLSSRQVVAYAALAPGRR